MAFSVRDDGVLAFGDVLVVAGGGTLDADLLQSLRADGAGVVAADGAADACLAAGVVPDAIIGDMDSLGDRQGWDERCKVIEIAEQDSTDFEKCLYLTQAPVTVALGMTGGRLDHTLAALDAVARYAKGRHIILVDETDLALGVSGDFAFEVAPGERVSVHPLRSVRFEKSTGLKYALDGLTLAPGVKTGTSNEAVDGAVAIGPAKGEAGVWLLIVGRHNLSALLARLAE